jgi:TolA-binding protein
VRSPAQRAFDEGFQAVRAGDFAGAAEAFATVERVGASRALHDAAFWRCVALARAGRTATAIESLRAFLANEPDSPRAGEASAMLGWLLVERGERAEAEREFRRARSDPSERVRRSAVEGMRAAAER